MKAIFVCVVVFVKLLSVCGQLPLSPCPGIFDYENDGYEVYGLIRLKPKSPLNAVQIKVNFTVATQIFSDNLGTLKPVAGSGELSRALARGDPFLYRLEFPIQSPLPRLTELTVNGKTLCSASEYSNPYQPTTSISLVSTYYISRSPVYPVGIGPTGGDFGEAGYFWPIRPPVDFSPRIDTTPSYQPALPARTRSTKQPVPTQPTTPIDNEIIEPIPPIYDIPAALPVRFDRPPQTTSQQSPTATEFECGRPKVSNVLIIKGEEYLRGAIPWLVALSKQTKQSLTFFCAGSLVSDRHVVTAAHCVYQRDQRTETESLVVTVGAYNLDDVTDEDSKKVYVKEATAHSGFDPLTLKNDIMVLTLKKQVVFTHYIIPVCLWNEESSDVNQIAGRLGVVAGWGTNEHHEAGRGKPRKAKIPIASTEECLRSNEDFKRIISDTTICAGDRNSSGPCNGDSGGGLYLRQKGDQAWRLRGVISISLESEDDDSQYDCNIQQYVVFTDAAKYTSWIRSIIETT